MTNRQARERVRARLIGNDSLQHARIGIGRCDDRLSNHRTSGIVDGSRDSSPDSRVIHARECEEQSNDQKNGNGHRAQGCE